MKKILLSLVILTWLTVLSVACTADPPAAEPGDTEAAATLPAETTADTVAATEEPAPETPPETASDTPVETIPDTLPDTLPETLPTTEAETEPLETAPDVLPALSETPAAEIIAAHFPEATRLASSTIGYEIILRDRDTAQDILEAFTEDGYYHYPIQTVKGAKFTVNFLVGKASTVAIYHDPDRRETRVVWEDAAKFDHTVLRPTAETDTGKLMFAQVGTERVSEKDNPMIGMIHIVKLSDGRAVIIDGGTGNERNVENILATLGKLEIAQDENGRYIVAAWILTHAHGDHVGAATALMQSRSAELEVDAFIYNFTKDAAVIGSTSGNIDPFVAAIETAYPDAHHIVAHAGIKYYFGNLTVSMLHAPELNYTDDAPLGYYNNSSLVFRLSVGQSSLFEIGDAGEEASRTLIRCYEPAAFQSNVLQITHHGLYTESGGHTWDFLKQVYDAVDADLAILPMQSKYAEDARNGRYTVMHDWAKAGYQISYIMDLTDIPSLFADRMNQNLWDEFETEGTLRGKEYDTLLGYDGSGTVTNADGLVTYLGSNRTTPLVVLIELYSESVRVVENREFYAWVG